MKVTSLIVNFRVWLNTGAVLACCALLSTSTAAQVGNASTGKTLYQQNCQSCHGSTPDGRVMLGAGKPDVISSAIGGVSQMLFLSFLTSTNINDIAAYLASIGPPAPGPTAQTISFPLLASQSLTIGSITIAPTATSGLPVSFAIISPAICSLSGNVVTLWLGGTCSISANQAGGQVGSVTYAAATQVIRSFVISAPLPVPLAKRGGIDINGTGKSSILVRSTNSQAPQMQAGQMSGGQLVFSPIIDPGSAYALTAFADLNGNGKSDLIFQTLALDSFQKTTVSVQPDFLSTGQAIIRTVKPAWVVQAVGDLDGDGLGDMVWRFTGDDGIPNDTGVSYIWFTNPVGSVNPLQVRKRGGAPLDWTLLGAADINFDGAADMVYISPANQVRMLMATPLRTCANLLASNIPINFKALKIADFTGGRRGDILMRNPTTGDVMLMALNAAGYTLPLPGANGANPDDPNASCSPSPLVVATNMRILPATDPTWQFYAAGDLDGDGIMDIVWLRADGTLTVWLMNASGGVPTVLNNAGTAPIGFSVFQP